jgi:hypothetical protein
VNLAESKKYETRIARRDASSRQEPIQQATIGDVRGRYLHPWCSKYETLETSFGGLDYTPELVTRESSDDKGQDCTLGGLIIMDQQTTLPDVPFQFALIVCQIGITLSGTTWEMMWGRAQILTQLS